MVAKKNIDADLAAIVKMMGEQQKQIAGLAALVNAAPTKPAPKAEAAKPAAPALAYELTQSNGHDALMLTFGGGKARFLRVAELRVLAKEMAKLVEATKHLK